MTSEDSNYDTREILFGPRTALYYPFPFIKNDNWLKLVALLWDSLYRIAPSHDVIQLTDKEIIRTGSNLSKIFQDEFNFLKDYNPSTVDDDFYRKAASRLVRMMDSFPHIFGSRMMGDINYFSWGADEYSKLDVVLRSLLLERGAIEWEPTWSPKQIGDKTYGYMRFKKYPGQVYMTLLAKEISRYHQIPVVTDDLPHHLILQDDLLTKDLPPYLGFFKEDEPDYKEFDPKLGMRWMGICNLTLRTIGIKDLSSVSAKTIAKVRHKYDGERKQFMNEIETFVHSLSSKHFSDPRQFKAHVNDKLMEFEKSRKDYSKALTGIGIETMLDTLKISLSIPIVDKLAETYGLGTPLALSVAGVIGVTAGFFNTHKKVVELRQDQPAASYLHKLGKTLGASSYFKRVRARINSLEK